MSPKTFSFCSNPMFSTNVIFHNIASIECSHNSCLHFSRRSFKSSVLPLILQKNNSRGNQVSSQQRRNTQAPQDIRTGSSNRMILNHVTSNTACSRIYATMRARDASATNIMYLYIYITMTRSAQVGKSTTMQRPDYILINFSPQSCMLPFMDVDPEQAQ